MRRKTKPKTSVREDWHVCFRGRWVPINTVESHQAMTLLPDGRYSVRLANYDPGNKPRKKSRAVEK